MTEPIEGKLYQFTNLNGNMNLPAHQYLLATEPSVLFATGIYSQAKWILPEIERILGDRPLDYIFVSHLEADECGGLGVLKKRYPKVAVLSTSLVASELPGFGYKGKIVPCDSFGTFKDGCLSLHFFGFPVETHGRDGLICYEENSGIIYSSDVIVRNGRSKIDSGTWNEEVESIDSARVPDEPKREKLKTALRRIRPKFIATGHGSCVLITE